MICGAVGFESVAYVQAKDATFAGVIARFHELAEIARPFFGRHPYVVGLGEDPVRLVSVPEY